MSLLVVSLRFGFLGYECLGRHGNIGTIDFMIVFACHTLSKLPYELNSFSGRQ